MRKLLIPLALLFINTIWAQQAEKPSTLPNIIPPSPTAYALGNYGNVPVGLFTGAPSISVPLFTYKTNNISLPLNMFYGSNGIKVDEVSSNVGLGWNLNFGGVITRTVRDQDDETSTKIPFPDNVGGGYTNPTAIEFFYNLGNSSDATDSEADMFSFNFNGISGKFFYDKNGVPHLIDQQAIKIEKNSEGFTLTLPNGEKYYFSATERTTYRTAGAGHSILQSSITAWYLTKIVHPDGDEVYFTYEAQAIPYYTASESQTLRMTTPYLQNKCFEVHEPGGTGVGDYVVIQQYGEIPALSPIQQNTVQTAGLRIKSINSNNAANGIINFTYTTNSNVLDIEGNYKIQNIAYTDQNNQSIESISFDYLNTPNKRNFLNSLTFNDPQKSYSFEYENPNAFPQRLSYSQDYWGYYNGKTNTNLIPKNIPNDYYGLSNYNYQGADKVPDPNFTKLGILKRVIYPTKGSTELEYEGNTYWGEKTIYPNSVTNNMSVQNPLTGVQKQEFIFTSATDQRIEIMANNNTTEPGPGEPSHLPKAEAELITDDNAARFYTWDQSTGQSIIAPTISGNIIAPFTTSQTDTFYFDAKAGTTYKLILSAYRSTFAAADVKYYPTAPQVVNTNLEAGGVRIKSTTDYDTSGSIPKYQRYYYAHKDDINHSSGNAGTSPVYDDQVIERNYCFNQFTDIKYLMLTSSSMIPQYDNNSNVFYQYVTVSSGGDQFEKGGEMKEYTIHRDYWGNNIWGNTIKNAPWTNLGWDNGLEKKSYVLRKNQGSPVLDIIQEKENNYEMAQPQYFESRNYTSRRKYELKSTGSPTSPGMLDNLDIMEYKNISYWHYLKSQKITEYLGGVPIKTEIEYFYDNPLHYQLNKQKTTFPDGIVNEATYSYAHEKGNQLMIGKNMVGIPLETVMSQILNGNTKIISKTETIYPVSLPTAEAGNLILPQAVKYYDIPNNAVNTEIKYDKYDTNGNLLQYTEKSGTPVVFVWGYGNTQPIAKVEGITYDQLISSGLISSIVTASDNDATDPATETSLINTLDTFRNHTNLKGYRITTFTYDLQKGVTSITAPSGIREVYIYDSYQRLKEIRENSVTGNILKEFKYNYKP